MEIIVLSFLAVSAYISSSALLSIRLSRGVDALRMDKRGILLIGIAGIVLHAAVLYHGLFTSAGLNLGFFNASSLISWLIAGLVVFSAFSIQVESLGIVILPLAAMSMLLGTAYPGDTLVSEASPPLRLHILISIGAYAMLALATMQAMLLALLDRELRRKNLGGFVRALPPLRTMERLLFRMIAAGFLLLSLALATGFVFLEDMFAQHLVHKTILSLAAWTVFGVLLWGRWRFGWRGRVALRWTLAGFMALMLAYFGSKFVLELLLA